MKKRLISTLLALCMVLALLPGAVLGAVVDSGTCGNSVTWALDADGTLTISGTGAMTNYTYDNRAPWYSQRDVITTVVIANGVADIGDWAFYSCERLTGVTIPDSVTTIGKYAFGGCGALTSVTLPDSVTSIGEFAFAGSGLTSVTIPDSVTTIEVCAFTGCSSLTGVNFGNGVTTIGPQAFSHCYSLTSVTIPDNVITIEAEAFSTSGLTNVTIGNGVTSIGDNAFSQCRSLTTVVIGNSVTSIGNFAFWDCESLTSVTIPNGVTHIGVSAFRQSGASTIPSVTPWLESLGEFAVVNGILLAYQGDAENVVVPNGVTSIGGAAFAERYSLASVIIPDGVTTICDAAFFHCISLTSVTIPDTVTTIEESAFESCGLTDVYYGGSESQWKQIEIDNIYDGNAPLRNATIHYYGIGPAVKYVYYSVELPGSWRAVASSLPSWLSANGNVLSGIPTQADTYTITLTDGSSTDTATITVRENGDNSVRASMSEGYVVVQEFPDIIQEESVWIIDDAQPPAPGEPDIFDRLLDVYLDGRKLKGGKLEDGQQIPDDWEYYARRGSLMTTLLTQTKANNTQGQHTLSVTISKPNNNSLSSTTAVDTVSTNYYVSNYDPQTESYPFSDGAETRYRDAIRNLVESGVITGFGDGTFRPKAALTRAQACAILARATGNGSASGTASFTDTSGHWAEGAIAWCASKGIVSGYGNGRFGPEEQLTGYAWSKMLFVALGFDAEKYGLVGSSWESNVMSLLREKGLDQGMNNFYPEQTIKREEACQLVYNAFVQKLISAS